MATGDPFLPGTFYTGQFVSPQTALFNTPFVRQNRVWMIEIDPVVQTSLLGFSNTPSGTFYSHYYINTAGGIEGRQFIQEFPNPNNVLFDMIGGFPPLQYIFIDETGTERYLRSNLNTGSDPTLAAGPIPQPGSSPYQLRFIGPYLDMIGEDGHSIYRMTINSSNVISVTLNRDEPARTETVLFQTGHPFLFINGRTYRDRLLEIQDITYQIPITDLGFGGVVQPKLGIVKVSLSDGRYDFLTHQDANGRGFVLREGDTNTDPAIFPISFVGTIESFDVNEDELSINTEDASLVFDREIPHNTYSTGDNIFGENAATSTTNVDPELVGHMRPIHLGFNEYFEPLLINRNLNLYQFHDGPVVPAGVGVPYQGGVPLTFNGDTPGGLTSWVPTLSDVQSGFYRLDTSAGLFRLAGPPGGRVSMAFSHGDTRLPSTGQYRLSDIIRHVLLFLVGGDIEIDVDSFNVFDLWFPFLGAYGIRITEVQTIGEILNKLLSGIGVIGINSLNQVYISALMNEEPIAHLTKFVDGQIRRAPAPKPGNSYRFRYRPVIQYTESDLLGGANEFFVRDTRQEYKQMVHKSFTTALSEKFVSTTEKVVTFPSRFPAVPTQSGQHLISRDFARPNIYTVQVADLQWRFKCGDQVLLSYPRWGLEVPKQCVITRIIEHSPTSNDQDLTTLDLWG